MQDLIEWLLWGLFLCILVRFPTFHCSILLQSYRLMVPATTHLVSAKPAVSSSSCIKMHGLSTETLDFWQPFHHESWRAYQWDVTYYAQSNMIKPLLWTGHWRDHSAMEQVELLSQISGYYPLLGGGSRKRLASAGGLWRRKGCTEYGVHQVIGTIYLQRLRVRWTR